MDSPNLADDIGSYQKKPDVQVRVHGLNEDAGVRWWNALKSVGDFSASRYNCAWAVVTALKAAGADQKISWPNVVAKYNIPLQLPSICVASAAASLLRSFAEKMIVIDRCTTIWTPADAVRYAQAIKSR